MAKLNNIPVNIPHTPEEIQALLDRMGINALDKQAQLNLAEEILKIHAQKPNPQSLLEDDQNTRKERFKGLKLFNVVRALLLKKNTEKFSDRHTKDKKIRTKLKHMHQLMMSLVAANLARQVQEEDSDSEQEQEEQKQREMQALDQMQKDTFQNLIIMLDAIETTDTQSEELMIYKETMLALMKLSPAGEEKVAHSDLNKTNVTPFPMIGLS